jgi:hypothetical protein
MKRMMRAGVAAAGVMISWLAAIGLQAETKAVAAAPIPPQILAAKRVFIANAGGEQPWPSDEQFSGGTDRAYNQFYAGVKAWGRYQLVATPDAADLLLEIQFLCPAALGANEQAGDSLVGRRFDPHFRLVIREARTNSLLWTFSERAQWALTRGNRDKNFDQTLSLMISDLQGLVSGAPEAADSPRP